MGEIIDEIYGNRVRVRVSGLCWQGSSLLLINHLGLGSGHFWAPPGGGVEFGETAEKSLQREFKEETGLTITVEGFQFCCEFIQKPLHAVELFFTVKIIDGTLKLGYDPEHSNKQIINEISFFDYKRIQQWNPKERHGIFRYFTTQESLKKAVGYWKI